MEKSVKISFLLDFYGNLLTKKQLDAVDLYYNHDLSLAEIADNQGISRQGVRDAIKRAEDLVIEMENKLHLAEQFTNLKNSLDIILNKAKEIDNINKNAGISNEINKKAKQICKEVEKLYN